MKIIMACSISLLSASSFSNMHLECLHRKKIKNYLKLANHSSNIQFDLWLAYRFCPDSELLSLKFQCTAKLFKLTCSLFPNLDVIFVKNGLKCLDRLVSAKILFENQLKILKCWQLFLHAGKRKQHRNEDNFLYSTFFHAFFSLSINSHSETADTFPLLLPSLCTSDRLLRLFAGKSLWCWCSMIFWKNFGQCKWKLLRNYSHLVLNFNLVLLS